MARVLITAGPTRQYLDPVRYLTNGSSGLMGKCLADAAIRMGHQVTIVSGPVALEYPAQARVVPVISTEEMLESTRVEFQGADGLIGVAAPCDYRPVRVESQKIAKTGKPLVLHLIETPDVVATMGASKRTDQWVVGFALETEDHRFRALRKLEEKCCDLVIINSPTAMDSDSNQIEMIDGNGEVILQTHGKKKDVSWAIMKIIQSNLIDVRP